MTPTTMVQRTRLRGSAARALALAAAALAGCVHADPQQLPPIPALPVAERAAVYVEEVGNASSAAGVAQFTAAARSMLGELLLRSRRYRAAAEPAAGDFAVQVDVLDLRDEDAAEAVVYDKASAANPRRRTVVELSYRVADRSGRTVLEGAIRGSHIRLSPEVLQPPLPDRVATGAFWNDSIGRATQAALDLLVRKMAEL